MGSWGGRLLDSAISLLGQRNPFLSSFPDFVDADPDWL